MLGNLRTRQAQRESSLAENWWPWISSILGFVHSLFIVRCHSFKFKGGTGAHTVMSTATHGSWKSSMGSTRRCANRLPRKCYQLLRFCSGPDLRPSQKMYFFLRRLRGWTDTPSVEAWTRPGFSGNCCFIISLVPAIYFGSLVLLTICRFFLYLIDLRNNAKEKKLRVLLGIFNWPHCII